MQYYLQLTLLALWVCAAHQELVAVAKALALLTLSAAYLALTAHSYLPGAPLGRYL